MKRIFQICLVALAGAIGISTILNAAPISLTASDGGGATSFNAAGKWSNAQAPSSANDYFTAGFLLRTPTTTGGSNTFAGNSLSLDFNPANAVVGLAMKYGSPGSILMNNLKLNGGAIFNGGGGTMSVYGNITVLTNSFLDPQANGRILAVYAPISGGSTNTIGVRAQAGSAGGIVQLLGDGSGYSGNWYIWGSGDSVPGAVLEVGNGGTSGSLGSGNITDDDSLWFNRSDTITVSNAISGPGSLVMAGSGTLILNATNTYTGMTTISNGILSLGGGGAIADSTFISLAAGAILDVSRVPNFGLASGQTLAGSGTVTGNVTSVSGAILSPGNIGDGTLTVNGDVTLGNCTLRWDVNTPDVTGGMNDLLVVNGNLTLNPAVTVNLVFPGGIPVPGTYTLCQCTGTLIGDPVNLATDLSSATFSINNAASPRTVTVTITGTNLPPVTNSVQLIKVYLQGGQSNSDGRARTNGLPANLLQPQTDVPFYYYLTGGAANGDGTLGTLTTLRPGCSAIGGGTTFGPELTFGRTLADYFALTNQVPASNVMVAIIKYAHGGTSLATQWTPNGNSTTNGDGPDYLIFQEVVRAGLSRLAADYPGTPIELDGMIWVQGETDIDDGTATSAAYGTNLVRFINDLRLTYATNQPYGTNLPFFFSRISANQTYYSLPTDASYSNYLLLRAGQAFAALSLSNAFMIDIDGPQFTTLTPYASPGLHFDTEGQQALGMAFGQALIGVLPPPQLQVPVKSGSGWQLTFTGISGTRELLERAPSLTGPWTTLTNIVLGLPGFTTYEDLDVPGTAFFYRASRP